jgi:chromosome segregation ATPase
MSESRPWTRADVLEEGISLAREQLSTASRRAERLETTLQERDSECMRMRAHIESLGAALSELRGKLDGMADVHQAERTRLEERYAAAEAHWLTEVDRARQGAGASDQGIGYTGQDRSH